MNWEITISNQTLIKVYEYARELASSQDLFSQFVRGCEPSVNIKQTDGYLSLQAQKERFNDFLLSLDYDILLDVDALNYIGMGLFKNLDESKKYCEDKVFSGNRAGKPSLVLDILLTPCLHKNLYNAFQSRAGNPLEGK